MSREDVELLLKIIKGDAPKLIPHFLMMIILQNYRIMLKHSAVFLVVLFGKLSLIVKLLASVTELFAIFVCSAFVIVFKIQLHFAYDALKLTCALAFK